jgi:prepilin-type processing-associated H-X9-DG protein
MCQHNLRAIGLAMNSYHAAYGSFPPAFIADENGHPIHSWRVLLLPFMGEDVLYKEYCFDEPWNGPHNSALHERLQNPHMFSCYSDREMKEHQTNYVAVVGPKTAMPGARSRKLEELVNGPGQTILIVEVVNSGMIHWMEPRDLNFNEICFGINDPSGKGIGVTHGRSNGEWVWSKGELITNMLMADGSVREFPETTAPRTVHQLLLVENK